jgi:hypothetical protein
MRASDLLLATWALLPGLAQASPTAQTERNAATAEIVYSGLLAASAHASDGSDRALDGAPRSLGPLGAEGVTHNG